jgi:hypothetical protein
MTAKPATSIYLIQSVSHIDNVATITGTVDGIPVTVTGLWSVIVGSPSIFNSQTYIAQLMQAAAYPSTSLSTTLYNGQITM